MPSENESTNSSQINTGGGLAITGDVNTGGGDFIGAQNIFTEETAYNVHGLKNPYLGLHPFTYEDREIYAGRDAKVQEALEKLTEIGKEQTILFVTGASGSGKSSFVKAGLLPGLQEHYRKRHKQVGIAIFHPSAQPLAKLDDALSQLSSNSSRDLAAFTPADQVNLLIIDQFEEVFTQAHLAPDAEFFQWLQQAPPFQQGRTHIIATVRSDYLNELFNLERLYDLNRYGLNLRTMSIDELSETIQRPLQVKFPNGERRFEPELVQKLAKDASARSTLLPLLQVSLQSLWKKGSLKLAAYTNLTDAIQQRAEEVYAFSEHVNDDPQQQRPERDQQELIGILLDLVKVSVDDADRRDVRQPRIRYELETGKPQRSGLIEELVTARLLAATREKDNGEDVEVIDIIHESLIDNWDRLRNAIEAQRQQLQRRTRFKLWVREWLRNGRKDGYLLLNDMQLAEARVLVEARDIEMQGAEAQEFYRRSLDRKEAEQRKELQRVKELTEVQRERAQLAETNVLQQFRANKRLRRLSWSLGGILIASLIFIMFAIYMGVQADARGLAWQASEKIRDGNLHLATLLALESRGLNWDVGDQVIQRIPYELPYTNGRLIHTRAPVNVVAWSPNGKILASGLDDNTIILWDAGSGSSVRILEGHKNVVRTLDWSPDGQILASGSDDRTIILWNISNGQIIRILKGHEGPVLSVDWNADGRTLASGSADKKVIIWDTINGKQTHVFQKHDSAVSSVAWSPNGRIFASGSIDRNIIIWNVNDMIPVRTIKGASGLLVHNLVWSPDGNVLASNNDNFTVSLWNPFNGKRINRFIGHKQDVNTMAWSPDGSMLASGASGSDDQTIIIWNSVNGKIQRALKASESRISTLAWSSNGHSLAAGSVNGLIIIWEIEQEKSLYILKGHEASVYSIAWNPNGKILASASADDTIILWDTINKNIYLKLNGHKSAVRSVAWSPDGRLLASGSNDRKIIIWEVATGKILRSLEGKDMVSSVAWSPDGRLLASGGGTLLAKFDHSLTSDNSIRIWDMSTGKLIRTLKGHDDAVESLAWSLDGRILASGSDDRTVILWDMGSGQPLHTLEGHKNSISHVAWSPDGKTLAVSSADYTISMWNAEGILLRILKGHAHSIDDVIWSSDGHVLASAGYDTVIFWDADSGKPLRAIKGNPHTIYSIAWSPDGSTFASGSSDNTIQLRPRIFTEDPRNVSRMMRQKMKKN